MGYRLVDELRTKVIPVVEICRLLGVIQAKFFETKRLAIASTYCKASVHVNAAFMNSGQSYGSTRIAMALANSSIQVGCYKVCRLQQASLRGV